ncbi:YciI family protein [Arthrobacter liuii]|uniref:YCII-related domain-containing protein n=1 Tax=Arthrobacter liuii TaxID=1476996 RepID=A0ABQ2AYL6_9MICC|nr:YciI family protein [Arthrobacter liuii]GGH98382.1 hypothetical protein GCM10007170_30790 [Arthrobacter liuii]
MTNGAGPLQIDGVPRFYVVFMTTRFQSFPDIQREAPEQLAEHVATSKRLHREGLLLMAGAFLDRPGEAVRTMGVLVSPDEAQHYAENDPFVRAGLVEEWHIREWANIFG